MENDLYNLITGQVDKIGFMMPLGKLATVVEFEMSELETNGWQVDFWVPATYQGKEISISGSMYYGNIEIVRKGTE